MERAIECFDRALRIDENYEDAWRNKAHALNFLLGGMRPKEAIECFDKAMEICEHNTRSIKLIHVL